MFQFNFFEFIPRSPFKQACSRWLNSIWERMPADATCWASVTKVKNGYFFSVSVHSSIGSFETETFLDETVADRSRRDWQVVALQELEQSMIQQLQKWLRSRRPDVQIDDEDLSLRKAS